jgi:hypothetical protein
MRLTEAQWRGATVDGDPRLWWLLHILDASGGIASANDDPREWIAAFCHENEGRDPDTFNIAANRGYIRVTHDVDTSNSVARITEAGRRALKAQPEEPSDGLR